MSYIPRGVNGWGAGREREGKERLGWMMMLGGSPNGLRRRGGVAVKLH